MLIHTFTMIRIAWSTDQKKKSLEVSLGADVLVPPFPPFSLYQAKSIYFISYYVVISQRLLSFPYFLFKEWWSRVTGSPAFNLWLKGQTKEGCTLTYRIQIFNFFLNYIICTWMKVHNSHTGLSAHEWKHTIHILN